MLSKEMNEKLTQVGPGTPMGKLLRYYWYPIAGVAELDVEPVKKVRLLAEDLVLYRDRSGNYGQCTENSLDPTHVERLHGYYMNYVWSRTRGARAQTGIGADLPGAPL